MEVDRNDSCLYDLQDYGCSHVVKLCISLRIYFQLYLYNSVAE